MKKMVLILLIGFSKYSYGLDLIEPYPIKNMEVLGGLELGSNTTTFGASVGYGISQYINPAVGLAVVTSSGASATGFYINNISLVYSDYVDVDVVPSIIFGSGNTTVDVGSEVSKKFGKLTPYGRLTLGSNHDAIIDLGTSYLWPQNSEIFGQLSVTSGQTIIAAGFNYTLMKNFEIISTLASKPGEVTVAVGAIWDFELKFF